jgi:hypothetical protein
MTWVPPKKYRNDKHRRQKTRKAYGSAGFCCLASGLTIARRLSGNLIDRSSRVCLSGFHAVKARAWVRSIPARLTAVDTSSTIVCVRANLLPKTALMPSPLALLFPTPPRA